MWWGWEGSAGAVCFAWGRLCLVFENAAVCWVRVKPTSLLYALIFCLLVFKLSCHVEVLPAYLQGERVYSVLLLC